MTLPKITKIRDGVYTAESGGLKQLMRTGWVVQSNVPAPMYTPCGFTVEPGWLDLGHMIVNGKRIWPCVHDDVEVARRIAREYHESNPTVQTRIREA